MRKIPDSIARLLTDHRLHVVDIGARGGWPPRWVPWRQWVTLIGFEPDCDEWARLTRSSSAHEMYIQRALYREDAEVVFYHTRDPNCSSLYPPNHELVARLRPDYDRMDVIGSEPILATTLDRALEDSGRTSVEFIKLDTQGSELDILIGGRRTIGGDVLGIEVEVEFLPLYKDQPLFADVHRFLATNGFVFMGHSRTASVASFLAAPRHQDPVTVLHTLRRRLARLASANASLRRDKQLLYADAVYLRGVDGLLQTMAAEPSRADYLAAQLVTICCATRHHGHASAFVELAHSLRLINDTLRRDLSTMLQSLSRSAPTLIGVVEQTGRRLLR